jgi:hypothetical protein
VKITLVTEGTYPHAFGGVSVWCDQLLGGMPEHEFRVCAITATGAEPLAWELPSHVSVRQIPLWGPASRGRAPRGKAARRFAELYRELLGCLLHQRPEIAQDRFVAVLRDLFLLSGGVDLSAALRGEAAVAMLAGAWAASPELARLGVAPGRARRDRPARPRAAAVTGPRRARPRHPRGHQRARGPHRAGREVGPRHAAAGH